MEQQTRQATRPHHTRHPLRCTACQRFARFLRAQDGAVTVDWVVLTAAVVGLAIASVPNIISSSTEMTDRTAKCMTINSRLLERTDLTVQQKTNRIRNQCGRV